MKLVVLVYFAIAFFALVVLGRSPGCATCASGR